MERICVHACVMVAILALHLHHVIEDEVGEHHHRSLAHAVVRVLESVCVCVKEIFGLQYSLEIISMGSSRFSVLLGDHLHGL